MPELTAITQRDRLETMARADFFQSLSNPVRLCILQKLCSYEELCVSEFCCCMGCSQPLVSKHLRWLKDAGFLQVRQEGTRMIYRLRDERVRRVLEALGTMEIDESEA